MRIYILFIFFSFSLHIVFGFQDWKEGGVVFSSGNTYEGKIHFHPEKQIVVLKMNQTLKAFTARKIKYFYFTQEEGRQYKSWFISKSKKMNGSSERYEFFEVLPYEKIMLFKQAKKVKKKSKYKHSKHQKIMYELDYTYYLLKGDDLEQIFDFGKQVLPHITQLSLSKSYFLEYITSLGISRKNHKSDLNSKIS